jgi:hypothetical protein
MIKLFDEALRIIFFPVRWANAVTTWIQNVCSPDDTLKINNTCSPKEGVSLRLSVNMQRVIEAVKNYFSDFWITPDKLGEALDESCDKETIIREGGRYCIAGDVPRSATNSYDAGSTTADTLANAQAVAETAPKPDKYIDENVRTNNTAKQIADNLIGLIGTSKFAARADRRHKLETSQGTPEFRPSDVLLHTSVMPSDAIPVGDAFALKNDTWEPNDTNGFSKLEISRVVYDEENGIHYLYYREVKYSKNGNPIKVSRELGAIQIDA